MIFQQSGVEIGKESKRRGVFYISGILLFLSSLTLLAQTTPEKKSEDEVKAQLQVQRLLEANDEPSKEIFAKEIWEKSGADQGAHCAQSEGGLGSDR